MQNPHVDFEAVKRDIAAILPNKNWDDGSLGPVLVRLAWHASGTYDKHSNTGGSEGGTMRFVPESSDGANAGLQHARTFLEPIKAKYPQISYGDLWTLAGVVAVEAMGGPRVPWKSGRVDIDTAAANNNAEAIKARIPPNGRLPDAALGASHIRDVFYRMGLNDKEIVALIGAHCVGRCHTDRSGYDGPWTFAPTRFSNQFFVQLLRNEWRRREWSGPEQFQDKTGKLMMTPSDLALLTDPAFRAHVEKYANDKQLFFTDFATAFGKLLELGVTRSAAGCPYVASTRSKL